jgi:hypothetical protein
MARSDYIHKMVNGERVELTEAEIDEFVAREEAWEKGAADRAWANIRAERNRRIAATDYYALSDVTMSDGMTAHRKALRDLPANTSDPVAFQTQWNEHRAGKDGASDPWPTKP